ncbi:MAG: endonuclease domain-containing protein [Bacteroidetes bacterium]|nr:MAG: endonuclease domain-containing protein [Bacteroidota bacterium]
MKTDIFRRNMFYGADSKTFRTAVILRKNMTLAELILWKKLKDRKIINTKFRRQHPVDIFIVDFYCHEYKIVIEIDGEIHDNEVSAEYDLGRTRELETYGIKIIRFTNDQVIFNIDWVITKIHKMITELAPLKRRWGHKLKLLAASCEESSIPK